MNDYIKEMALIDRQAMAASIRAQLTSEKTAAKGNTKLLKEINDKLASLDDLYLLNEGGE